MNSYYDISFLTKVFVLGGSGLVSDKVSEDDDGHDNV